MEKKPRNTPVSSPVIHTDWLTLRQWKQEDLEPFARMNADRRVMEFFPDVLTRDQSNALADWAAAHFLRHGFGPFAVELTGQRLFVGFIGLVVPSFEAPFTPCVEIGWRIAAEHWGHGFATEGAREVLRFAFKTLGLPEVVSFTVPGNIRSRRVMEKIGMKRDLSGDFEHPKVAPGHPLRQHVLYRISA